MGGGRQRAATSRRVMPQSSTSHPLSPMPPLRHSCAPSPSFLHAPFRHSCAPSPSFPHAPFRHSCAGRNPPPQHPPLFPNSSLPPSRGEVRWGVGGNERPPAVVSRPSHPLHTLCGRLRASASRPPTPRSPSPASIAPAPTVIPTPKRGSVAGKAQDDAPARGRGPALPADDDPHEHHPASASRDLRCRAGRGSRHANGRRQRRARDAQGATAAGGAGARRACAARAGRERGWGGR